jgi:hypothetical protein
MISKRINVIIAALPAGIAAVLTLGLGSDSGPFMNHFAGTIGAAGTAFLLPGIFGAIAISGNAHAFHLWVASIWNFIFYFLLCWALAALIGKAFRRLSASKRAGKS